RCRRRPVLLHRRHGRAGQAAGTSQHPTGIAICDQSGNIVQCESTSSEIPHAVLVKLDAEVEHNALYATLGATEIVVIEATEIIAETDPDILCRAEASHHAH